MIALHNHIFEIIMRFCFINYDYLASNYLLKENIVFEQSATNDQL